MSPCSPCLALSPGCLLFVLILAQTSLPLQKAFLDLSGLDVGPIIVVSHGTLHFPVTVLSTFCCHFLFT